MEKPEISHKNHGKTCFFFNLNVITRKVYFEICCYGILALNFFVHFVSEWKTTGEN